MNVFVLGIIAAVILLDKYAIGEFGVSQPIVSGTIIGAIFGDISSGIFVGAILQLIFLGESPFGGDIEPDGQAAGIIGAGSYFLLASSNPLEYSLFLAIVLALVGGMIGGVLEMYAHIYNEKLYRIFMKKKHLLYVCHFAGLITAFLRGLCLLLPIFILAHIVTIPRAFPQLTKELLMIIGLSVGLANGMYLFVKKSTILYLCGGIACSLLLFVL